jgi:hypothetical protein
MPVSPLIFAVLYALGALVTSVFIYRKVRATEAITRSAAVCVAAAYSFLWPVIGVVMLIFAAIILIADKRS